MLNRFLFFLSIFAISVPSPVYSQGNIDILLDSAEQNMDRRDVEGCSFFLKKVESLLNKNTSSANLLIYHNLKGQFYFSVRKPVEARKEFLKALPLSNELNDTLQRLTATSGLAGIHCFQGDYTEALTLYEQVLKEVIHVDEEKYYNTLTNMATPYTEIGEYQKALDLLLKTGAYFKAHDKKLEEAIVNNNIGELYRRKIGDYAMAREHFQKAIAINKALKNDFELSKNYNNIGLAFMARGIPDSAIYFLNKSMSLKQSFNDEGGTAIIFCNLGNIYLDLEKYPLALNNFRKVLKVSTKLDLKKGLVYGHLGLGEALSQIDRKTEAQKHLIIANQLASDMEGLELKLEIENALFVHYKKYGEHEQALLWLEKSYARNDNLHHKLRDEGFSNIRGMYEKELRLAENNLLKAQHASSQQLIAAQAKTKNLLIILAVFLLLVVIALLWGYHQRQKALKRTRQNQKELEEQYVKLSEQEIKLNELNLLKNKIFSVLGHDLRSPLGAILSIIRLLEHEQMSETEKKEVFSHLKNETELTLKTLENILAWSRLQMHEINIDRSPVNVSSLMEEGEILHISAARIKKINLYFDIEEDLHIMGNEHQIRSIFGNLLTNAIKFSPANGVVKAQLRKYGDTVEFRLKDNGKGIDPDILKNIRKNNLRISTRGTFGEKGTGIGLKLVQEFVDQNGGNIYFDEVKHGTEVVVSFPVQNLERTTANVPQEEINRAY